MTFMVHLPVSPTSFRISGDVGDTVVLRKAAVGRIAGSDYT
jgi:hypothetical protein